MKRSCPLPVVPPRTGHAAGLADRGQAAAENRRNGYEYQVLVRLAEILPADVRVRVVADRRGFGDHKLYRVLTEELKFDFVIAFRGNIAVTTTGGEARAAAGWVGAGGRARTLRGAAVAAEAYPVAVVCVRAKGMKEPWCLAARCADEPARALIKLYAKRWRSRWFPRHKDLRFGMGLGSMQRKHAGPARPSLADQCLRGGLADAPRRRRRTTGLRSASPRPTRPGGALIRCSVRGACFTNSCRT